MQDASRVCPLCDARNARSIVNISAQQIIESSPYYDDLAYAHLGVEPSSRYSVVRCGDCQFVFSAEVPSDNFLSLMYESSDQQKAIRLFARPSRASYAFSSLAKLLEAIAQRTEASPELSSERELKILDVGCAYGVGSLGLSREHYPYQVTGVEWSEHTRAYLESQGMTCYRDVSELPKNLKYDGVLLNDVLEHVPDPRALLHELKARCHADTVIWINVPDFVDWRLQEIVALVDAGKNNVPADFNPWEHLSYFSPHTLDRMLQTIGATRAASPVVHYPIDRSSGAAILKSLLRLFRDLMPIFNKQYPDKTKTSGLFYFD